MEPVLSHILCNLTYYEIQISLHVPYWPTTFIIWHSFCLMRVLMQASLHNHTGSSICHILYSNIHLCVLYYIYIYTLHFMWYTVVVALVCYLPIPVSNIIIMLNIFCYIYIASHFVLYGTVCSWYADVIEWVVMSGPHICIAYWYKVLCCKHMYLLHTFQETVSKYSET